MKLSLPTSQILLQLFLFVGCGSAASDLARQQSPLAGKSSVTVHRQSKCSRRSISDYPVGIFLGPTQLVASHYDAQDHAVTLAAVPANPAWRQRMVQLARDGNAGREADETLQFEPIWDGAAIVPSFMEAMNSILNATEAVLGHVPTIGYIVLPHNTTAYWDLLDMVMHHAFAFYHPARDGDYIVYDIVDHRKAAQYAYRLPWDGVRDAPELITTHDNDDEDTYFLLANLEADYLELARVCILDVCDIGDQRPQAMLDLGEDALWPTAVSDSSDLSSVTPSPSWHFGQAVQKLADAILAFMNGTQRDLFRGIVLSGGASERAMAALRLALREALPYVNDTQFYDTIAPSSVLSLGAGVVGRNAQLSDERDDCDCSVDEHDRKKAGYPSDDEFPCNRIPARLDRPY